MVVIAPACEPGHATLTDGGSASVAHAAGTLGMPAARSRRVGRNGCVL